MNRSSLFVATGLLVLATFTSCTEEKFPGYTVTPHDLYYQLRATDGSDRAAEAGDYLTLSLSYALVNDSTFFSTSTAIREGNIKWIVDSLTLKGGFREGLSLLHEGDSASFVVNTQQFYQDWLQAEVPDFLDKQRKIKVATRIQNIETAEEVEERLVAEAEATEQREIEEQVLLQQCVRQIHPDSLQFVRGVYYQELRKGTGIPVEIGTNVSIQYEGAFVDGTVFESTYERQQGLDFTIGNPDVRNCRT